jgi:hypothetical protein
MLLLIVTGLLLWQTRRKHEAPREIVTTTPTPFVAPIGASTAIPTDSPTSPLENVIAQLNDGEERVTLDQAGRLSGLENLPPAYQQMVKYAITHQRLEKSSLLAGLNRSEGPMMGGNNGDQQFFVTEPIGKALLTERPTFRWSPLQGATSYTVKVYDEKFNLVISSPPLTTHSWTTPQPFDRGGLYSWQVKANKDGQEFASPRPPAPQANFRILDQTTANEIAHARRAYASSHLTLGLLYAQAGLLDEAEGELRALQKSNPTSPLVRRWLANVQAMRQ